MKLGDNLGGVLPVEFADEHVFERTMEEAIGRPNSRKYDKHDVLRLYEEAS